MKNLHNNPIYQKIFDQHSMSELFGDTEPSVSDRTRVFFELWREWECRSVRIVTSRTREIRSIMSGLGFREHFEFQIRNGELRCMSDELLAMANLNGLDQYRR